jgi:hypothetical protein
VSSLPRQRSLLALHPTILPLIDINIALDGDLGRRCEEMSVRIELDRRGTVFTCLDYVTGRVFSCLFQYPEKLLC